MVTLSEVFQVNAFCGVATHGAYGLVDTAAQSGLIGEEALGRLEKVLAACGLKVRRTDRKAQARGVGGEAKVREVVEIPLGLGGVNGILEATVVAEDVPLLIPVRLLRELRAVIDFSTESVSFKKHGTQTIMSILPSGHASVSITEFANGKWELPIEAQVRGISKGEFEVQQSSQEQFFMSAIVIDLKFESERSAQRLLPWQVFCSVCGTCRSQSPQGEQRALHVTAELVQDGKWWSSRCWS
jgi:hypothetical protein